MCFPDCRRMLRKINFADERESHHRILAEKLGYQARALPHSKRQPTSQLAQNVSSSFPRGGDKVSAELHDVVADYGFP